MDAGSLKAPAGVPPASAARPVVNAPVAPTQLPPAKAVAPVTDVPPARHDPIAAANQTIRDVILDPQSREVVFRILDARSRQTVRRLPAEARLKLRAYARALEEGESPEAPTQTDMKT